MHDRQVERLAALYRFNLRVNAEKRPVRRAVLAAVAWALLLAYGARYEWGRSER